MKKIKIAFDVDGTLRDNTKPYDYGCTENVKANEEMRSLLITLSKFKNIECHIWSGAGIIYATQIREIMNLQSYVKYKHCHGKDSEFRPDIAIDDIHDFDLGGVNLIVNQK